MMKNQLKKFNILFIFILLNIFFIFPTFSAKYTITNGIDFNLRVKSKINNNSNFNDETIISFKRKYEFPKDISKLFDISEDNDSSVLAYIDNRILYYICEDDVYLNEDSSYMFANFFNLENVDFTEFDFSKVENFDYTFANCINLKKLDMDNDTTINLNSMEGMFLNCQSIEDIYIHMLKTKKVKNFNHLFDNCINLKNIHIYNDNFSITNLKSHKNIFSNCKNLKTNFNNNILSFDDNDIIKILKAGNDNTEGVLKDLDYEYDDYGENEKINKIDSINKVISYSNSISTFNNYLNNNTINFDNTNFSNISTDSELYDIKYDVENNDKITTNNEINNDNKTYSNDDFILAIGIIIAIIIISVGMFAFYLKNKKDDDYNI